MAIYHFSAQIISRKCKKFGARSVVACAAYRAGARLKDERNEKLFDYSKRKGVVYAEILLPEGADKRLANREELWNEIELMEKRKDSQLAREINIALPHELTHEEREELLREYVKEQFVERGMVADIAIHEPVKEHGDHRHNHHAHIMLTLRQAHKNGFYRTKTREWNSREQMKEWRKQWAEHQNRALERAGKKERVDHRTLAEQREEAISTGNKNRAEELKRTPEIHVGVGARQMERKTRGKTEDPAKEFFKWTMKVAQEERQRSRINDRKLKNKTIERMMQRTDSRLGSNYIQHFAGKKYNGYGAWTREYRQFVESRAKYNKSIIEYNRKQAVLRRERLQIKEFRFQQKRLEYMAKKTPHARRRVSLLEMLLGDIADALMQAAGAESRRSQRLLDYNARFLSPSHDRMFDMNRERGGGRERFLH